MVRILGLELGIDLESGSKSQFGDTLAKTVYEREDCFWRKPGCRVVSVLLPLLFFIYTQTQYTIVVPLWHFKIL